jgi:tetratricopeptide (TPR) repeat protein
MGELEFLFKHSLARDTIYNSILFKTRKELHLKVALAIEKVFAKRIREFYGVLAYHCSIAEELVRAEKYMLKAGEEALKSSASSEALHYYQEALSIYLKKHGDAADPEKIAALERNIALALFNRGQYLRADEYFGKALAFYGEKIPRHPVPFFLKFIFGLSSFIIALYFPILIKKKKSTSKDSEIINLLYKKNTALIVIDPKKMFMESFFWLRRLIYFDISSIDNGINILSMSSAAFSYPGISFALSRKVLNFVQDKVDRKDMKSLLYYELPKCLLCSLSGNWEEAGDYNEDLVRQNLKIGEMFYTTSYIMTCGGMSVEKGDAEKTAGFARDIFDIADKYEHDYARAAYFWFNTQFLMKWRRIRDAMHEAEKGIEYTTKTGFSPFCFSLQAFKARIYIFQGEYLEAVQVLDYLDEIKPGLNLAPYLISTYLSCRFLLYIRLMEAALNKKDAAEFGRVRKLTRRNMKKTLRVQKKTATDTIETFYLTGTFFWLIGRQKAALKWWKKAILTGEKLQTKLEQSRAFMEVGRRLQETSSRYDKLGDLTADQYLDKAAGLFKEMDLQWDLEQLGRIRDISR